MERRSLRGLRHRKNKNGESVNLKESKKHQRGFRPDFDMSCKIIAGNHKPDISILLGDLPSIIDLPDDPFKGPRLKIRHSDPSKAPGLLSNILTPRKEQA